MTWEEISKELFEKRTAKQFIIVDLLETLAIADDTECKYYQNSNDDFKKLCKRLNELHKENQELRDMELEDRDIVFGAGKFRLEEWGKHRYHQFYNGDEEMEDESVVLMLLEQSQEIKQLKEENKDLKQIQQDYEDNVSNWFIENWQSLTDEQRQTAHLELGIELEDLE